MAPEVRTWMRAQLAVQEGVDAGAMEWYDKATQEIAAGVSDTRFGGLISLASRKVKQRPAAFSEDALIEAANLLPGWNPFDWSALELARVGLILAREDLKDEASTPALVSVLEFADMGETVAVYRSMAFLPRPADFVWQAAEGCRSNMSGVFRAIACDNPFPAEHFDDVAWRSLAIKALFSGAPLWRVQGLDGRLGEELAIVALDLADERRAASRPVQAELWLCLGTFGGDRALESMKQEVETAAPNERCAAAFGLARAGQDALLRDYRTKESDPAVLTAMDRALAGEHSQVEFRTLHCPPH
jgi:hypothetical protein